MKRAHCAFALDVEAVVDARSLEKQFVEGEHLLHHLEDLLVACLLPILLSGLGPYPLPCSVIAQEDHVDMAGSGEAVIVNSLALPDAGLRCCFTGFKSPPIASTAPS